MDDQDRGALLSIELARFVESDEPFQKYERGLREIILGGDEPPSQALFWERAILENLLLAATSKRDLIPEATHVYEQLERKGFASSATRIELTLIMAVYFREAGNFDKASRYARAVERMADDDPEIKGKAGFLSPLLSVAQEIVNPRGDEDHN